MQRRFPTLVVLSLTVLAIVGRVSAGVSPLASPARAQDVTSLLTPPSFENQRGVIGVHPIPDPTQDGPPTFAISDIPDPTAFPTTTVRVHNYEGLSYDQRFWLSVRVRQTDPGVQVVLEPGYAQMGLIAPGGDAEYTVTFPEGGSAQVEFEVDGSTDAAAMLTILQFALDSGLTAANITGLGSHSQELGLALAEVVAEQYLADLPTLTPCANAVAAVQRGLTGLEQFTSDVQGCLESPMWQVSVDQVLARVAERDWFQQSLNLAGMAVPQLGIALKAVEASQFAARVWTMYDMFHPEIPGAMVGTVAFLSIDSSVEKALSEATTGALQEETGAAGPYTIIVLGTLGGDSSEANGINSAGQIVGEAQTANGEPRLVLWEDGQIRDLTMLSDDSQQEPGLGEMPALSGFHPWAINDVGQIVGWVDLAEGGNHAALWKDGRVTDLGTLGGNSWATAINNAGQIIGNSWTGDATTIGDERAVTWVDEQIMELGTLGGDNSTAFAINDAGHIAGAATTAETEIHRHATLWVNGQITDLGTLGGDEAWVNGINEVGQIVGSSETADGELHATLWEHGLVTNLGTLGGDESRAAGINETGQIVGTSETADGQTHAVLWENGQITDLGTLGGETSYAKGINDLGQVIGSATTADGQTHAVLWQPTAADTTAQPSPSSDSNPSSPETSTSPRAATVPMLGGNPGHTGEMPGPGPQGSPVELWRVEAGDIFTSSPAVYNGLVYIGSEDGNLYAFDAATGIERWRYFTGDAIGSSPAVADGLLYATSGNSTIYAVDAATGTERWSYFLGGDRMGVASPTVADGVVYVGGMGNLYALDAATGDVRWRYEICCPNETSPSVVDGVVYLVATGPGDVVALDAVTGTERWRFESPKQLWSLPVVADGMVYFGTAVEGDVFALDAATGTERWRFPTGETVSTLAVVDGVVYVGSSDDGQLHALDATTGAEQWVFTAGGEINYSSPAVADGTVYFGIDGDDSGILYAIDATNGEERWSVWAGDRILSSPAVIDGIVYVGVTMYGEVEGGVVAIAGDAGTLAVLVEGATVLVAENTVLLGAPNAGSVEVEQVSAETQVTLGTDEGTGEDRWWHVTVADSGIQGWVPANALKPAG